MFLQNESEISELLFGDLDGSDDFLDMWQTSQEQFNKGSCNDCGRSLEDPITNGYNPLLSLANNPSEQKLKMADRVICSTCDRRDMFHPYINIYQTDWEKGTEIINVSDILPIKEELKLFEDQVANIQTDQIWNEIMMKKEKLSDYGSDSNLSDFNEFSDEFSDFLYSDDPASSLFSEMLKSEDSIDEEDKMIDVVSLDQNEVLPSCSSHSAQVAEMHNYSTPAHFNSHHAPSNMGSHHAPSNMGSHHTPLAFRNVGRNGRPQKRTMEEIEEDDDNDSWSPSSSDSEDKETSHMFSRMVKRRNDESPQRRGRRTMFMNSCEKLARRRENSEERDYYPEPKRRKEFDDKKREIHNSMERDRRNQMSQLIQQLRSRIPDLGDGKKYSKVVILDAASTFVEDGHKYIGRLFSKEKRVDACISKLKKVLECN